MRPTLELDLGPTGRGTIKLDDIEIPFATAIRVEVSVTGPTDVAIEFHPAATATRLHGVALTRRTVDGLQEICRQWRKENDERSLIDMAALRAFELWTKEQVAVVPPPRGPAAFDRFVEIYRDEICRVEATK